MKVTEGPMAWYWPARQPNQCIGTEAEGWGPNIWWGWLAGQYNAIGPKVRFSFSYIIPNTVFPFISLEKERCITPVYCLEWMLTDLKSIPHYRKQCLNIHIFTKNVECYLPGRYLVQITTGAVGVIRLTQNMAK